MASVSCYSYLVLAFTASPRTGEQEVERRVFLLGFGWARHRDGLELYGFLVRFRITRWGPVTTIYETVFWVALATSALGLALELLWRKKYSALAASWFALLATVLAENVSLLSTRVFKRSHKC